MRIFLVFLLSLLYINSQAQDNYDYLGVIKLSDSSLISYKISFIEKDGLINGHSITDIGGAHETKSFISGYFDDKQDSFNFYESGILYTKSPITQNDFCYVHFNGKLKKLNNNQQIEGKFKGLYDNSQECIHGEITLTNFNKALKKATKLDRKVDKSIFVSQEKKDKVNMVKTLDSLSMNLIRKDEVMSIFTKNDVVTFSIYDAGQEDGDQISVWVNDMVILKDYTVTAAKKEVVLPLKHKKTRLRIKAINTGSIGGNTVKLDIIDAQNEIETLTNLQAGETAELVFLKN